MLVVIFTFTYAHAQEISTEINNAQDNETESSIDITRDNVEQQLIYANSIRTSSPQAHNALLAKLIASKSMMNQAQQHLLRLLIAYKHTYDGKYNEAIKALEKLIAEKPKEHTLARSHGLLVNVSLINKNWLLGFKHLAILKDISSRTSNKETLERYTSLSVMFYRAIGQYEIALDLASEGLKHTITLRDKCFLTSDIVNSLLALNKISTLDIAIQEVTSLCDSIKEHIVSGLVRTKVANKYIENGEATEAISFLLPYEQIVEQTLYPRLISEYNYMLAKAYWSNKQYKKSEQFARKAYQVGRDIITSHPMVDTLKLLYQLEKLKGNSASALNYLEEYIKADKAYLTEATAKAQAIQIVTEKTAQKEAEIKRLNQQNIELNTQKQLARAKAENSTLLVTLLVVISIAAISWVFFTLKSKKRLKALAEKDALTGIFNRGKLVISAEELLKYSLNTKQPVSCIMFDLDLFKSINDQYGHLAGDKALQQTAQIISTILRKADIFARLGGEEFCIILPQCNSQAAMMIAEKCRDEIAQQICQTDEQQFSFTASFGVTTSYLSGYDINRMIADSDTAMYQSKEHGRNQVTLFSNET
ncbi:GGDEF domain-containing protein [Thalassotalea sp. M1531]|uniref:diguanylate cyclase n=2 Tax=Thalassotalea algicola TaxID=2716224 RepID=A0A7Y0Q889_9GAMM|nr:GGDEF domain-containing protein [Thalassotalea algicola]